MKDLKTKEQFLELRARGKSLRTIEQEIGVGRRTLAKWENENRGELEKRRTAELEALQEKYSLTTQAQIERYGAELARVHEEIQRRDLADVPTPKLYDLSVKLHRRLDALYQMFTSRDDDQIADQRALRAELQQLESKIESAHKHASAQQADSVFSPEREALAPTLMELLAPYPELRQELSQRLLESVAAGRKDGNNGNGEHNEVQ